MDEPAALSDYLSRTMKFLSKHSWIFKESNTEFVEKSVLDNFPKSWIKALQNMKNEEFNRFPFGQTTEEIPEDLANLIHTIQELRVQGRSYCRSMEISKTEERIKGMSPKKSHEIIRLGDVIRSRYGPEDILVDLGCGLVSKLWLFLG